MTVSHALLRAWPYLFATAVSILLFFPTWARLFDAWLRWEQTLAHGLPTFLAFLALLIVHPPLPPQSAGPHTRMSGRIPGGILLLITVLLWATLELVRIDTLAYLLLPASLFVVCWTAFGLREALTGIPYIALLGLSLPLWGDLIPALVALATFVVSHAVSTLGITALIEGNHITLPYGRLVIADGCSGMGYLAISLLLGAITAVLNDFRWRGWLWILLGSAALALIINWVRIIALVVIAYMTDMNNGLVREHELFGWVVFVAFIGPAMFLVPVHRRKTLQVFNKPVISLGGSAFIVASLLLGHAGLSLVHAREVPMGEVRIAPGSLKAASYRDLPVPLALPTFLNHQVWRVTGSNAVVSVAQFQRDSKTTKIVPYLPPLIDRNSWFLESSLDTQDLEIWRELSGQKRVILSRTYRVGPFVTDHYRLAKLLQIPAIYLGKTRFALVTVQAPCHTPDCGDAVSTVLVAWKRLDL
ncbi:MAG TPA: exosortase/archaeosortase family protein [Marinobacter sp.]|uniref:exosortase/archaeosortase family protein n=1 Tax=Marinobacter sp. TaxID=50741 RepID=UPI002D8093A0|nr:exosortase/archaeosortase family protein [Marinobacter sp.]HET8802163.1 exosortase/archaeosortase family protein [Marinobacter sp.]